MFEIDKQYTWLVTGAAGFIGSHIVEELLKQNQKVVGLDNLSACGTKNLDILYRDVPTQTWANFVFKEGDIRDLDICQKACIDVDFILHHAAIGSVPKSFEDPNLTDGVNVGGFLNVVKAGMDNNVKKFIYASSSAVYGDYTEQPNKEDQPVKPLSPYAVSKYTNELYAQTLSTQTDMGFVGLRYFNVYGPRQDPNGAYAAVIPKWIDSMIKNDKVEIYGDGTAVRDFCFVKDVVRINICFALQEHVKGSDAYNVASSQSTTMMQLFSILADLTNYEKSPKILPQRQGDIKFSLANIHKISALISEPATGSLNDNLRTILKDMEIAC